MKYRVSPLGQFDESVEADDFTVTDNGTLVFTKDADSNDFNSIERSVAAYGPNKWLKVRPESSD